jgi:hypothetical protein
VKVVRAVPFSVWANRPSTNRRGATCRAQNPTIPAAKKHQWDRLFHKTGASAARAAEKNGAARKRGSQKKAERFAEGISSGETPGV